MSIAVELAFAYVRWEDRQPIQEQSKKKQPEAPAGMEFACVGRTVIGSVWREMKGAYHVIYNGRRLGIWPTEKEAKAAVEALWHWHFGPVEDVLRKLRS